jgi:hypothetical protein
MSVLRRLLEVLIEGFFTLTRIACFAQATAFATAVVFAGPWTTGETPAPWVRIVFTRGALLLATFLATAIVLLVTTWFVRASPREEESGNAQPLHVPDSRDRLRWLGLSMSALAALAWWQAGDLVALWREILVLLDRIGLHEELLRSNQFSGVVLGPIFAALYAPAVEAFAAFMLIVLPLALLPLLGMRSPAFPRLYLLMATCQTGLVLAAVIASDLFARIVGELLPVVLGTGDAEGHRVAEELTRARSVLASTGTRFFWPLAGFLAWVPAVHRASSQRASAQTQRTGFDGAHEQFSETIG